MLLTFPICQVYNWQIASNETLVENKCPKMDRENFAQELSVVGNNQSTLTERDLHSISVRSHRKVSNHIVQEEIN